MIFSFIDGFIMPTCGVFFAFVVAYLIQYSTNPDYFRDEIYKLVYMTIGLAFFAAANNTMAVWTGAKLGQNIIRDLRLEVFGKLLKLPLSWFNRK